MRYKILLWILILFLLLTSVSGKNIYITQSFSSGNKEIGIDDIVLNPTRSGNTPYITRFVPFDSLTNTGFQGYCTVRFPYTVIDPGDPPFIPPVYEKMNYDGNIVFNWTADDENGNRGILKVSNN